MRRVDHHSKDSSVSSTAENENKNGNGEDDVEDKIDQTIILPIGPTKLIELHEKLFPSGSKLHQQKFISPIPKLPDAKTILIVEDNIDNQTAIRQMIRQANGHCIFAENGADALTKLKESANQKEYYSLIIMDCHMPVMDGFDTTKAIRQGAAGHCYRDIPIVALTAKAMDQDKEQCLDAGMDDYLSKPIQPDLFYHTINRWMSQPKNNQDPSFSSH